jgi:tRNA(adenine34) deaminase
MNIRMKLMLLALEEAYQAYNKNEVPVGAVIATSCGDIMASAHNRVREYNDPTAHAEILAIRAAVLKYGEAVLSDCVLYTTLEPCMMCFGALIHARVAELCYAAPSQLHGVFSNHLINELRYRDLLVYQGVMMEESQRLLAKFFATLRY